MNRYISAFCLIALDATAAGPLSEDLKFPQEELLLSQAFYYGIYAAILYFVVASLMVVTFWGASTGHYGKDFELTSSQRTLMLQTIMFLLYLLLGALVFSKIEGWKYFDAVYWADVTLFTVGFGDYTCQTTLGRALMMPFALIGIISLGLVIGSIRSLILERGRRRMAARMEEKRRRRVVRSITLRGDEILEPIRQDIEISPNPSDKAIATEFERRRAEFELMRKIQSTSSVRRRWAAMAISTGVWLVLWLVGAVIFQAAEEPYQHWSYFDSFYFCFEALTTIGYGDVTPISNAGKSFFVFWSLLALPTMTVLISNAGDTVVKFIRDGTIRVGNVTILPGEEDFVGNVKHIISKLTCGKVCPRHLNTAAPGVIVDRSKQTDERLDEVLTDSDNQSHNSVQDENRGRPTNSAVDQRVGQSRRPEHDRNASTYTSRVRRDLSRLRDPSDDLPIGADFHFLLISEIQVIATHLKESKPRRYTYEQWAWYLRLIGEDERSAETHRRAKAIKRHQESSDSDAEMTWSWIGDRSPLMGSKEESEWILERLVDRLRESLSAEGRKLARGGARKAFSETKEPGEKARNDDAREK